MAPIRVGVHVWAAKPLVDYMLTHFPEVNVEPDFLVPPGFAVLQVRKSRAPVGWSNIALASPWFKLQAGAKSGVLAGFGAQPNIVTLVVTDTGAGMYGPDGRWLDCLKYSTYKCGRLDDETPSLGVPALPVEEKLSAWGSCPLCGSKGRFGFSSFECTNHRCRNYVG